MDLLIFEEMASAAKHVRRVVAVVGTSRPGNFTSMALAVSVNELRRQGVEVALFDAAKLTLGFPGSAPTADSLALTKAVTESTGVIIATPEYHGTFSAATKLIIENMGFPSALKGKAVGLIGVAAGRIGAIKTLEALKGCVSHVGGILVPNGTVSIAGVQGAFDPATGKCIDSGAEAALVGLSKDMQSFIGNFICPRAILEDMVREGKEAGKVPVWTTTL